MVERKIYGICRWILRVRDKGNRTLKDKRKGTPRIKKERINFRVKIPGGEIISMKSIGKVLGPNCVLFPTR